MKSIYTYKSLLDSNDKEISIKPFYQDKNISRYNYYLINYLLKYVQDQKKVFDSIKEVDYPNGSGFYGTFENKQSISCIVPKRNNLYDEMVSIHEITHLINALFSKNYINNDLKEVIPYFNEYHYLKLIDEKLANDYLRFRKNLATSYIDDESLDTKKYLCYVKAYLVLHNRKDNYDIDELNKINQDNNSKRLIVKKKYTL